MTQAIKDANGITQSFQSAGTNPDRMQHDIANMLSTASPDLGAVNDAMPNVGAVGSISAKLRRISQTLSDLLTGIVLSASNAIIGRVGIDQTTPGTTNLVSVVGNTKQVTATPTITAGTYATGKCVGGLITLTNAYRVNTGQITLQDIVVTDKANQSAPFIILFFDSNPTGGTYNDGSSTALGTDLAKVIGKVKVAATDYDTIDSKAIASVISGIVLQASGAISTLYAVVTTTGSPSYVSTSALTFTFKF
jgi:hypothetical protein